MRLYHPRPHPPHGPTIPHVHAPLPPAPDVPTVPRGAGCPIREDAALQEEGAPLEQLEVRISAAARRAQRGYSPYT